MSVRFMKKCSEVALEQYSLVPDSSRPQCNGHTCFVLKDLSTNKYLCPLRYFAEGMFQNHFSEGGKLIYKKCWINRFINYCKDRSIEVYVTPNKTMLGNLHAQSLIPAAHYRAMYLIEFKDVAVVLDDKNMKPQVNNINEPNFQNWLQNKLSELYPIRSTGTKRKLDLLVQIPNSDQDEPSDNKMCDETDDGYEEFVAQSLSPINLFQYSVESTAVDFSRDTSLEFLFNKEQEYDYNQFQFQSDNKRICTPNLLSAHSELLFSNLNSPESLFFDF